MKRRRERREARAPRRHELRTEATDPAVSFAHLIAALRRSRDALSVPQILETLGIDASRESALRSQLDYLEERGVVFSQRRGRWSLHARARAAVGNFVSPRGTFGFVARDDGEPDLYVPMGRRRGARHGDLVLARVASSRGRLRRRGEGRRGARERIEQGDTGEILAVLKRRAPGLVGQFVAAGAGGFIHPRDERLGGPLRVDGRPSGVKDGDVVWAEREGPEDRIGGSQGRILSVVGSPEDPGVQRRVVDRLYELPGPFPEDVEREAASHADRLTGKDREGREDFTGALTVTIDPEGARDHDDAVGLEVLPAAGGTCYRLAVHIADVAHYVPEGSALDREALRRGTSVYFPGRHIPMIPARLSSGLCSLVAGEDRLTQTVVIDFDQEGNQTGFRFADGVIRSRADLTYQEAAGRMSAGQAGDHDPMGAMLPGMARLAGILRQRRMRRGSLDLDMPETRIDVDDEGRPREVGLLRTTIAHRAIEEFMLAANETVAGWLAKSSFGSLYRIHEDPDQEAIDELEEELADLGFRYKRGRGTASARLRAVLDAARGSPEEPAVAMMVLRTLKLARYSHEVVGHFGLAAPIYTHFTSPIRRYPDLVVHRILRAARGAPAERRGRLGSRVVSDEGRLAAVALECSSLERRAEEAERAMEGWLEAVYMKGRIGEELGGVVTGRTARALFVTLEGLGVEGLVPLAAPVRGKGRPPAPDTRLGDSVRVRVKDVDTFRAKVFLRLLRPA